MKRKLLLALTLTLTLTACSPQIVREYVKPECSPPPKPTLPEIDAQALHDAVGEDTYGKLLRSNWKRDAYAEEMRVMLMVLCKSP